MQVLIVKTSSLGDLLHTFPAVTDALAARPGLDFHWLVEEDFLAVPAWHPGISEVIPIALRRWRKGWRKAWKSHEIGVFAGQLRQHRYDLIIDAQGLLKSALPARLAHGPVAGFDRRSARESLASLFYQKKYRISRQQHAVERLRSLFAQALGYPKPEQSIDYGLAAPTPQRNRNIVLLHATTWNSKHWPESYWIELAKRAQADGYAVELPWHGPLERLRAERIIAAAPGAVLLPAMSLTAMKDHLAQAAGAVGVDTGLAHIAAAVDLPAVNLYGATNPVLTGARGRKQQNLAVQFDCAPCFQRDCDQPPAMVHPPCYQTLPPTLVWERLQQQMEERP